ncbi:CIA30 family protein [Halopseudomonas nanhaiensis]|uniref:CIA30 family protein n=1 Tax=Halopseudomonas nanhaiensis TaxID=2830842 RepID=UPI001CC18C58|nr:CIA30 family protein [Halopseudomonas nanhaiensis]UAW97186.1 CIA30 family protein [Halopseudomonas nanhaiensis]
MSDCPATRRTTIGPVQLIDVYQAQPGEPSPWVAISDQVMGGLSTAAVHAGERNGSACSCLSGRTRLENNGGFVQMKLEIDPHWHGSEYSGLFIELCGAVHDYNLNIKTTQLDRPWQSFRHTVSVGPQWTRFIVPYAQLTAHRTDVELDPARIRSAAVVAIGSAFDVDVCVRRFGFFHRIDVPD